MTLIGSDIETGPLPEDFIRSIIPSFDPANVKLGNRSKPDVIADFIAKAEAGHEASFIEKAALSPVTGQVLVIGYFATDSGNFATVVGNEPDILRTFWSKLEEWRERPIVGHNFKGFDIPFCAGRSIILGIDVPEWVFHRRYISDICCFDTMERWSTITGNLFVKLGRLAEILGVGEKDQAAEVTGENFHKWWNGEAVELGQSGSTAVAQREKALEYLLNDVVLVTDIAARMGVI